MKMDAIVIVIVIVKKNMKNVNAFISKYFTVFESVFILEFDLCYFKFFKFEFEYEE